MTRLRELLDAISMLPDMEHRPVERQQLVDEIGCDLEWRRTTSRRCAGRAVRPVSLRAWIDTDATEIRIRSYADIMSRLAAMLAEVLR